jgi:hypothetical protein
LENAGIPSGLSDEVAAHFIGLPETSPDNQAAGRSKAIFGHRAIRDEDLKLIDLACAAVIGGASLASGVSPWPTGAAVLAATIKTAYAWNKKGAYLRAPQVRILLALKANPDGLLLQGLTRWLADRYGQPPWNEDYVRQEMDGLKQVQLPDGTTVAMVMEDRYHLWFVAGI